MIPFALIRAAREAGATLAAAPGGMVRLTGGDCLPPELREALRCHRDAVRIELVAEAIGDRLAAGLYLGFWRHRAAPAPAGRAPGGGDPAPRAEGADT